MKYPVYGDRLFTLRTQGKRPEGPVIVSFVGHVEADNFLLIAKTGQQYDWRIIVNLPVIVVVDDGRFVPEDLMPIVKHGKAGDVVVWHLSKQKGGWAYLLPTVTEEAVLTQVPVLDIIDFPEFLNEPMRQYLPQEIVAW